MTRGTKKILVLGAGLVSEPLVRYLLDKGYALTVADLDRERASKVIGGHRGGQALLLDVTDERAVSERVRNADLVVSLVPYTFHPMVARHCLEHGKHLIAPSYVSDAMAALDGEAKAAGLTFLNEIGVDPGIDHMSAMRVFDALRKRGGTITSFRSYCGGLPAPDSNDNPFGYKFTWSPRGVLLASRNSATFMLDGRVITAPSERLFRHMYLLAVDGVGDFEAYPNRDSISYRDTYGLADAQTIYRATLRNIGWCDCMYSYRKLGLLDLDEIDVAGSTYADFMRRLVDAADGEDVQSATARRLGLSPDTLPVTNLRWLGMFSEQTFDVDRISPLDALGKRMNATLMMTPEDRDMIVMVHTVRATFPDGHRERVTSKMIHFGRQGGPTAMSTTVALPAAAGAHMLLTERITTRGVLRPIRAEIYEPVLDELAQFGITCEESTETF